MKGSIGCMVSVVGTLFDFWKDLVHEVLNHRVSPAAVVVVVVMVVLMV